MARPRKLTNSVMNKLCEAIEVGANYDDAAAYAGVSAEALDKWRSEGAALLARVDAETNTVALDADELRLWRFYTRFVEAEGMGAVNCAIVLHNASMKDPQWALRWLERRRSKDWKPTQRQELTGAEGGPVQHDVHGDMLERMLQKVYGDSNDSNDSNDSDATDTVPESGA